ncbi:MAG: helix-turn-helix domain-containing protein, partial [Syntrophobacteraceae bacterium]
RERTHEIATLGEPLERSLRQRAGCCRFDWNEALAQQKECLDAGLSADRSPGLVSLFIHLY